MDVGALSGLLDAAARLIGSLAWPLLAFFLILYFGRPLKEFLSDIGEGSFKLGPSGIEAAAKRQVEAAAALGLAEASKRGAAGDGQDATNSSPDPGKIGEIATLVSRAAGARDIPALTSASALWVDDRPSNNVHEMRALESVGIRMTISTSTKDALEKVRFNRLVRRDDGYDAIISDMARGADRRAGYELLEDLRRMGSTTPFIIYGASASEEERQEARRRGAFGRTTDPGELFELVTTAVKSGRPDSARFGL